MPEANTAEVLGMKAMKDYIEFKSGKRLADFVDPHVPPAQVVEHHLLRHRAPHLVAALIHDVVEDTEITVQDICGRAGCSIGTFYGRVESKEGLLDLLRDRVYAEVKEGLILRDAGGYPAHGNQRKLWDAGCRFDHPNPDYR